MNLLALGIILTENAVVRNGTEPRQFGEAVDKSEATGKRCEDLSGIERRVQEWKDKHPLRDQQHPDSPLERFELNKAGKGLKVDISPADEALFSDFIVYFDSLKLYLQKDFPCIPKGNVSVTLTVPKWPGNSEQSNKIKRIIGGVFTFDGLEAQIRTIVDGKLSMKLDDEIMTPDGLKAKGVRFAPPRFVSGTAGEGEENDDYLRMDVVEKAAAIDGDYQFIIKKIVEELHGEPADYQIVVIFDRPVGYFSEGESAVEKEIAREFSFQLGRNIKYSRIDLIKKMLDTAKKMKNWVAIISESATEQLVSLEDRIKGLWQRIEAYDMSEHPKEMENDIVEMDGAMMATVEIMKKLGKKIKYDSSERFKYDKVYLLPWNTISFSLVTPRDKKSSSPVVTVISVPKSLTLDGNFQKHGFKVFQEASDALSGKGGDENAKERAKALMLDFYALIKNDADWQRKVSEQLKAKLSKEDLE